MTCIAAAFLAVALGATVATMAQEPRFEAAALKRNTSGEQGQVLDTQGQRFVARNVTLRTLILNAYRPRSLQLAGAPSWVESDRYDPRRDASAGAPSDAPSLFTALQEQLGLRLEPGRAPVQALVIDRIERPAAE